MKTTGLSWDQAENLLRTGMARFIEFERQYLNVYYFEDGNIKNRFRDIGDVYLGGPIGKRSRTFYKFKVVNVPNHCSYWDKELGVTRDETGKIVR